MLKQRVITAIVGVALVMAALFLGAVPWHVLVWFGSMACVYEFCSMHGVNGSHGLLWWALLMLSVLQWIPSEHVPWAVIWMLFIAIVLPVLTQNKVPISVSSTVLLGTVYIAIGGNALDQIRHLESGLLWIWLFLLTIWLTDTVAFFLGSRLQGPKLWPAISPKKTVSGAVSGVVAAAVLGACASFVIPHTAWWSTMTIAIVISIVGQIGDLVESAYKRSAGVKDSGRLLPGHGGILDRVDSMIFAAPFAFQFIVGHVIPWLH